MLKNDKKRQKFRNVTGPTDRLTDQGVESRARD